MVKSNHRKQVLDAFNNSQKCINYKDYSKNCILISKTTLSIVSDFISKIINMKDVESQLMCIKSFKLNFLQVIENSDINVNEEDVYIVLENLFLLYIDLNKTLKSALEWTLRLPKTLKRIKLEDKKVLNIIIQLFDNKFSSEILKNIDKNKYPVDDLVDLIFTLDCFWEFHKIYSWLDTDLNTNTDLNIGEESYRDYVFFQVSSRIFQKCEQNIFNITSSSLQQSKNEDVENVGDDNQEEVMIEENESFSSSEILRYVECCGESARNISCILSYIHRQARHRPSQALGIDMVTSEIKYGESRLELERSCLKTCLKTCLKSCIRLLLSSFLSGQRDTLSTTGMALMLLQQQLQLRDEQYKLEWTKIVDYSSNSSNSSSFQEIQFKVLIAVSCSSENVTSIISTTCNSNSNPSSFTEECLQQLSNAPKMSKLALLRSCLSLVTNETLHGLSQNQNDHNTFDVVIPQHLLWLLATASASVRLYSLQVLDLWLGRVATLYSHTNIAIDVDVQADIEAHVDVVMKSMEEIGHVLFANWAHPNRIVKQHTCTAYKNYLSCLTHIQPPTPIHTKTTNNSNNIWYKVVQVADRQCADFKARYQALALLCSHLGVNYLLKLLVYNTSSNFNTDTTTNPTTNTETNTETNSSSISSKSVFLFIQKTVAACSYRDISGAARALLGAVLSGLTTTKFKSTSSSSSSSSLSSEAGKKSPRYLWCGPVVEALCSLDRNIRRNTFEYLLPEVFKCDKECGPYLIQEIRSYACTQAGSQTGTLLVSSSSLPLYILAGLIAVVSQMRVKGLLIGTQLKPTIVTAATTNSSTDVSMSSHLWSHEVCECLRASDPDLRIAGLKLIASAVRSTDALPCEDDKVLRSSFCLSLKSFVIDDRQRLCRLYSQLLLRMCDSSREAARQLKHSLQKKKKSKSKSKSQSNELEEGGEVEIDTPDAVKTRAESLLEWLLSAPLSVSGLYPGSPPQRETLCLELMDQAFKVLHHEKTSSSIDKNKNKNKNSKSDKSNNNVIEKDVDRSDGTSINASDVALGVYRSEHVIRMLLSAFTSSWDKSRSLALRLVQQIADLVVVDEENDNDCFSGFSDRDRVVVRNVTLAGVTSLHSVRRLRELGLLLTGSPRMRESDAGAALLELVMTVYSVKMHWLITDHTDHNNHNDEREDVTILKARHAQEAVIHFLLALCEEIEKRLNGLQVLLSQMMNQSTSIPTATTSTATNNNMNNEDSDEFPLCYGLFTAVRNCVNAASKVGLLVDTNTNTNTNTNTSINNENYSWRALGRRLLAATHRALDLSLSVVADSQVDAPFAPLPKGQATSDRGEGRKGANKETGRGNTLSGLGSAGPINARIGGSGLSAGNYNNDVETGAAAGPGLQRAIVGAWLLVKETSSTLALLVELSPPPTATTTTTTTTIDDNNDNNSDDDDDDDNDDNYNHNALMTAKDISEAGEVLLDALSRLKHMGAIAETHMSLQRICQQLFSYGERSPRLCRLPTIWTKSVLSRLLSSTQVFILRRSAGFAYSFLSLLRSEPSNCTSSLLPYTINALLEAVMKTMTSSDSWRVCVHSLNILRLILLDSCFGSDLDSYVVQCIHHALVGFQSPEWAIRNSAMMVFAAVVQRVVDNEKSTCDAGYGRAPTPYQLFQRFPGLYSLIVSELESIVGVSSTITHEGEHRPMEQPSLYPILLLLAKLRPPVEDDENCSSSITTSTNVGIHRLLVLRKLVCACVGCSDLRVRSVTARAMEALTPHTVVASMLLQVYHLCCPPNSLDCESFVNPMNLIYNATSINRVSKIRSSNYIHGTLLVIGRLLLGVYRALGISSPMRELHKAIGSNAANIKSSTRSSTEGGVFDMDTVQEIVTVAFQTIQSLASDVLFHNEITTNEDQLLPYVPSIVLELQNCMFLLRGLSLSMSLPLSSGVLEYTNQLNVYALTLPVSISLNSDATPIITNENAGTDDSNGDDTDRKRGSVIPAAPTLWLHSIQDVVHISLLYHFHHHLHQSYSQTSPVLALLEGSMLHMPPLSALLHVDVMEHEVSEVREGFLKGCSSFLVSHGILEEEELSHEYGKGALAVVSPSNNYSNNKQLHQRRIIQWLTNLNCKTLTPSINEGKESLLTYMLHRMHQEKEPPVRSIICQLVCVLMRFIDGDKEIKGKVLKKCYSDTVTSFITERTDTFGATIVACTCLELIGKFIYLLNIDKDVNMENNSQSIAYREEWCNFILISIGFDQDADLRLASLLSMYHSGALLKDARMILCVVRALQDDDEEVREVACTIIQGLASVISSSATSLFPITPCYAVKLAILPLTVALETNSEHLLYVLDRFRDCAQCQASFHYEGVNSTFSLNILRRDVFETDEDNLYFEPLIEGDVLARVVTSLLHHRLDGNDARHSTFNQIYSCVSHLSLSALKTLTACRSAFLTRQQQEGLALFRGGTYHQEIFIHCYLGLLSMRLLVETCNSYNSDYNDSSSSGCTKLWTLEMEQSFQELEIKIEENIKEAETAVDAAANRLRPPSWLHPLLMTEVVALNEVKRRYMSRYQVL